MFPKQVSFCWVCSCPRRCSFVQALCIYLLYSLLALLAPVGPQRVLGWTGLVLAWGKPGGWGGGGHGPCWAMLDPVWVPPISPGAWGETGLVQEAQQQQETQQPPFSCSSSRGGIGACDRSQEPIGNKSLVYVFQCGLTDFWI